MAKEPPVSPLAHPSCKNFDEFVEYLETEVNGFRLKNLAEALGCSTERIRRIRLGQLKMDVNDITVLAEHYSANPLFLLSHVEPKVFKGSHLQLVNEGQALYGSNLQAENKALQEKLIERDKAIKDKDKIIALYETRFVLPEVVKKSA
jgi:hypothetical protein